MPSNPLLEQNYTPIPLQQTTSQHLLLTAYLHNIPLHLIIDTGANHSCLDKQTVENLNIVTQNRVLDLININGWMAENVAIVTVPIRVQNLNILLTSIPLIDLSHINHAFSQIATTPIHGIIGADVLQEYQAIIDYAQLILYLKKH